MKSYYIAILFVYLAANSIGLYNLKMSIAQVAALTSDPHEFIMTILTSSRFVLGAFFYIFSFLLWIVLIAKNELSFIIPIIISSLYISSILVGVVCFDEQLNSTRVAGIIIILVGVIILSYYGGVS